MFFFSGTQCSPRKIIYCAIKLVSINVSGWIVVVHHSSYPGFPGSSGSYNTKS